MKPNNDNRSLPSIILLLLLFQNVSALSLLKNIIDTVESTKENIIEITDDMYSNIEETMKSFISTEVTENLAYILNADPQTIEDISAKYKIGEQNEDMYLNITQLIAKYGYPVEQHEIYTSDGYLLTLFRIRSKGYPVLIQHGLFSNSDDFITAGPGHALPYLLADQGYDVWIGNVRGNKHTRKHKTLSPDSAEFWQFSWDEMGRIDMPTMIDYILEETGYEHLKYVGHSQGTTVFFVMCSERPEYNKKVSLMVAFSAVAWIEHIITPVIKYYAPTNGLSHAALQALGQYELLPDSTFLRSLRLLLCGNSVLATLLCNNLFFLLYGFDYQQQNVTNLPVIFSHTLAGSSTMQFTHYAQEVVSGKFRRYDHGSSTNLERYGSETPPEYDLDKITAPVAIYYGTGDWISVVADVERLRSKLPNVVEYYKLPLPQFNHVDFLWGTDVKELLYDRVIQLFTEY